MIIPGSANPLLLATTAAEAPAAAYQVDRSLRLNDDDSAYLGKTFSTAGNRRAFTFSAWVKRCETGATQGRLFGGGVTSTDYFELYFPSGDELRVIWYSGGQTFTTTTAKFRDPGAWFHVVLAVDTTLFTASDRVKIYINGTLQDRTSTNPSQNFQTSVSKNVEHNIGRYLTGGGSSYFDGYVAEVNFIDGQTLEPTAFAGYDSDKNWNPKEYNGTYGPRYSGETWSSAAASTHGFDGSTAYNSSATRLYGTSTYHKIVDAATAFTGVTSVIVGTSENVGDIKLDGTVYSTSYTSGVGLTVTNPPSSFSDIEVLGASGGLQIAYVRVSGELLINYGVHANNSFALTFSDNSSNSALGDDTSGNTNDWTVYNIQASSSTVTHWRQASSSDNPSNSVGTVTYRTERALTDPQTSALVWDHQNTNVIGLQNITGVTSLRLKISSRGSGAKVGVNTGAMVTVGAMGGDYNGASDANSAWYTWSNPPSTITSIAAYGGGSGTGNFLSVWAIEVNGSRVIDTSAEGCDSLIDTPTNYDADSGNNGGNYCVWNPLKQSSGTYSDGNLQIATSSGNKHYQATFGLTSGKWYWEVIPTTGSTVGMIGIALDGKSLSSNLNGDGAMAYYGVTGYKQGGNTSGVDVSYGATYTYNDVIGVALDLDSATKTLTFYKNGSSQGVAFNPDPTLGSWHPAVSAGSSINTTTFVANFGQRPFKYTPPTGHLSVCTQNLTDPTIADPSKYMDIALWTGNGSTQTITGMNLGPEFLWVKARSAAYDHYLQDVVRGVTKTLELSGNTAAGAETTNSDGVTALTSDGFSVGAGTGLTAANVTNVTYVGWGWDAGTTTVNNNTDGSITPTGVRANADSGCSIVTYTGNGSSGSVGHGLSVAPEWIFIKNRDATSHWHVYHVGLSSGKRLNLSNDEAEFTPGTAGITTVTSSTFTLGSSRAETNANNNDYVAYCFAPVSQYSSFGSFEGNGLANGVFVSLSFRPSFILIKGSNFASNWYIQDDNRDGYNVNSGVALRPNLSNGEDGTTTYDLDILSNGFKLRSSASDANSSGKTFIYCAFASHPFKTARAR